MLNSVTQIISSPSSNWQYNSDFQCVFIILATNHVYQKCTICSSTSTLNIQVYHSKQPEFILTSNKYECDHTESLFTAIKHFNVLTKHNSCTCRLPNVDWLAHVYLETHTHAVIFILLIIHIKALWVTPWAQVRHINTTKYTFWNNNQMLRESRITWS